MRSSDAKRAPELDRAPDPAELLAAKAAGLTLVAWRAAGKPRAGAEKREKTGSSVRPWHPYRSKWEADYAHYLDLLIPVGNLVSWDYEPDRLEIGVGAFYTPDFRIITRGVDRGIQYHEVKGYRREAAIVRLKAEALRYPQFRFVLVTKANGEWHHTTIGASR